MHQHFKDIARMPRINNSRLGWVIKNVIGFESHPGPERSKSLVTLNKVVSVL